MSDYWVSVEWLHRLAGSLLHFFWQGAVLAFMTAVVLRLLARRSAALRYNVAVIALGLMLAAPCVTVVFYPETGAAALRVLQLLGGWPAEGGPIAGADGAARWTGWIVFVWATGVAACASRLMGAWLLSLRLIRSAEVAVPPALKRLMQSVQAALLPTGPAVRLRIGERVGGPVVFGWLRPVVLLPVSAVTGLNEDHLLAVLAHELAHVRRHDFLVNTLQRCVESVLFYHPAVWWLSARIRAEREHCCDDLAASVCGDRFAYAQALIELERTRVAVPALAIPAAAGRLAERIRRQLGVENANRDWQPAVAALVLVAICALAGAWQSETIASPTFAPPPPLVMAAGGSTALPPIPPLEGALGAIATVVTAQTSQPASIGEKWITTWGTTSREGYSDCCNDQTVRMFMRASVGGASVRVRLSNAEGTVPLFLGQVRMALRDRGSQTVQGSDRSLFFGGRESVEIPVGETITSDPVKLDVPALADLAISIYAPNQTGVVTGARGERSGYRVSGDQAARIGLTGANLTFSIYWVSGIEVLAPATSSTVVVVGGSTASGEGSTREANRSWPNVLAARLQANGATKNVAVVVSGSADSLLNSKRFPEAFDKIVTSHVGVQRIILGGDALVLDSLAINSLRASREPYEGLAPAEWIIKRFRQVIDQARAKGIATIGCTLTPFSDGPDAVSSGEGKRVEAIRVSVNEWIRSSGAFDGVVDFDAVSRDGVHPHQLMPELRLERAYFNDRGHKALADAIDLSLFTR